MIDKIRTIGNTPMIKFNYEYKGKSRYVYIKLEYYNLTGSIKDRVAYYIIRNAICRGELKDEMIIAEATSGNTGISLAALGAFYKHPVYIFMPDWVSKERVSIMKSYGAIVKLYSKKDGGFIRCIKEAEEMAKNKNVFLANQFANKDNILAHYETTAEEMIRQLPEVIYGFISGVGTGGTLMGVGRRLKEVIENFKTVAIEPNKMPLISSGKIISEHKIEGIGDEFVPDLVERKDIDDIILIDDEDAINMSRRLSKEVGLGVGISSGANLLGAILLSEKIEKPVVTVFPDDNKKYLSTDLTKPVNTNMNYISNQIKLKRYEIL